MIIKALTIQQPYAHLIALPDGHPDAKRVENRTWGVDYVGPIAIHAGKGRDYLEDGDLEMWPDMAFGAIVAVATLAGCVRLNVVFDRVSDYAAKRWPWLRTHKHTEGPVCWVLENVRRLAEPIYCPGQRGLWDVTPALIAQLGLNSLAKR